MKISKTISPYIFIGLVSLILNVALHSLGTYNFIESRFYDMKFKLRGPLNNYYEETKENDVVIVEIDDDSYHLIKESYPYPRGTVYGDIINNLTKAQAKVIVFDIMFDSPDHTYKIINQNLSQSCNECTYEDQDKTFAKSIRLAEEKGVSIVLAAKIAKDNNRIPIDYLVSPNQLLMESNPSIGIVNQGLDINSLTNKKYSILSQLSEEPDKIYPSLALQSVQQFNDISLSNNIKQINNSLISYGNIEIQTVKNEASIFVNYYGPVSNVFRTFKTFSLSQVIDTDQYTLSNYEDDDWMDKYINKDNPLYSIRDKNGQFYFGLENNPFKDKIVIIGSSLEEDNDFIVSPFYNYKGIDSHMPGVELHANAIQQILDSNYIQVPNIYSDMRQSPFIIILFISIIISLTLCISNLNSSLLSLCFVFISSTLWFSISIGYFLNDQLWMIKYCMNYFFNFNINYNYIFGEKVFLFPVFYPISTIISTYGLNLSYKIFKEQSDKNFLKLTFGKYVSPKIIDSMYKEKKLPELGGESGIRTAYFSDIESFSTISEQLSSKGLVDLLNEYLSSQTEIILEHKGTLDKYEGDSIVAFFGAPVFFDNHASEAIDAAIKCQNNLNDLNNKWKNKGNQLPEIVCSMKMRTGVNTGDMVTGNMGSKYNMNYTMIGDVVNIASRLESSAKQYGIYLHSTIETLDEAGKDNYLWRYIDKVQFVGKTIYIQTVEVLDFIKNSDDNNIKLVEAFHNGLKKYYKRDWDGAIESFIVSQKLESNNIINPSQIFIKRAEKYKKIEPNKSWCGINILDQK